MKVYDWSVMKGNESLVTACKYIIQQDLLSFECVFDITQQGLKLGVMTVNILPQKIMLVEGEGDELTSILHACNFKT